MDVCRDLARELTRIITCPYPASLTKLADILAHADGAAVRTCIDDRPQCALRKLATLLSDALPLWPYALRVLQVLCQSQAFRNTLLQTNLGLLDSLLAKAHSSQRDFDEYAELCVLLLSQPLPDTLPLPASAQPFFLRVFEKAARAPNVDSLKPVYSMLNGACRGLLTLLSPDARQSFDNELCQILSSSGTGQNSMLMLWCFGIVILAEDTQGTKSLHDSSSPFSISITPERRWATASARKLFGSTSGINKTINLTYLSVIWASKGDVGVSDTEAIEAIRIATKTVRSVNQALRESWPNSTRIAQSTFPKLPTKILRKDINPILQLEAICFYATIAGQDRLSSEIIEQYELALCEISKLDIDAGSLRDILSISMPLFAPHVQVSTTRLILSTILGACSSPHNKGLSLLSVLVEELTTLVPNCAHLRSHLLLSLTSHDLQESLENFLRYPASETQDEETTHCSVFSSLVQRKLHSATVTMLLTCALTASSTEGGLSPNLAIRLVNMRNNSAQLPDQCTHSITRMQPTVSLFQQECTPVTGQSQQNWKDRLKSEIEMQGFYQRDAIVRSVALICQDLEDRCENTEQPLRREQAIVKDLTGQVSQLQEQLQSLETEAMDRRNCFDGLEAEMEDMENERDDLLAKLDGLRLELSNANRQADETLREAQEGFSAKDAQYRSIILTHEEDLQSRQKKIDDLNNDVQRIDDKAQKWREESNALNQLHEALKAKFSTMENDLQKERQINVIQEQETCQLKHVVNDLEHRLNSTTTELMSAVNERDDLQAQHEELIRSSEHNLQAMETQYENDIKDAAAKANESCNALHIKLDDARRSEQEARNAYEDAQKDLELLKSTNENLEEKNQQLTDACTEKDDELRSFKSKVLASVGFSTEKSLPIRSGSHEAKTNPKHRRRRSAVQPQVVQAPTATAETQDATCTAMEDIANASFTSTDSSHNGSTPKRPKPRPSFKVPTVRTPCNSKASLTSRAVAKKLSPTNRIALRSVSPNRRHTTVGFVVEKNEDHDMKEGGEKGKANLHMAEHESFDMDKFLESTPFTPGMFDHSTGRMPDVEETTEL